MNKVEPAFKENIVPVVFTSSSYYVPYLAVSMKSIIDTADQKFNYDIIVLHKEISEEAMSKMRQMTDAPNISIRFVKVDEVMDGYQYNYREGYSSESFYRVVMVEVLEKYERVVYLDCDVIVKESISGLITKYDISEYCVAAANDIDGMASSICDHENRKSYMLGFMGLKRLEDYFQSGVMVFNLKKIRETYSIEQILKVACASEIMYGDQDVLNVLFHDKVLYLDMSWNVIIDSSGSHIQTLLLLAPTRIVDEYFEARKHPYIIHYAGRKPWNEPDTEWAEEYWKVARTVPFYEEILKRWEVNELG